MNETETIHKKRVTVEVGGGRTSAEVGGGVPGNWLDTR